MVKLKNIKSLILILLLISEVSISQSEISVENAIEIGLKNNFDIQIARKNFEISSNNTRLGTSGFLPTLDMNGNYGLSRSDQETNSPFSFGNSKSESWGANLSLNWTIFDGFKMFVDNKKYIELEKLGQFQTRNIIENNVVLIMRSYYYLVQQELLRDVALNSVEISEDRLEKSKLRNELGGASTTDVLNAQVSLNNDLGTLLNSKLNVGIAKKELNIVLGQKPDEDVLVNKTIDIPELNQEYDDLLRMALEKNASILLSQQNKIIAEETVKQSQSALYPRITLNGSYGYSDRSVSSDREGFTGDVTTTSKDGNLGLTFSFNLFNGFRNDIDIQSRQIDLDIQSLAYSKAKNELIGLVKEKFDTFRNWLDFIRLEEQNVEASQQNLLLQEDRFATGASSSLEFRDAQVNLARAKNTLITALYQARIALLEIEQLVGDIRIN